MEDFKLELYKIFRTQFEMWKENEAFLKSVPRNFVRALIQDGQTLTSTGEIGMYRTIKKVIHFFTLVSTTKSPFSGLVFKIPLQL